MPVLWFQAFLVSSLAFAVCGLRLVFGLVLPCCEARALLTREMLAFIDHFDVEVDLSKFGLENIFY